MTDRLVCRFGIVLAVLAMSAGKVGAQSLPMVETVEAQPLLAQVKRIVEAMEFLGTPLPAATIAGLESAGRESDDARVAKAVQAALDSHCLMALSLPAEGKGTLVRGPADPALVEQGWRQFLVKVVNGSGTTSTGTILSPSAMAVPGSPVAEVANRWLDLLFFVKAPLQPGLSGLGLEYRVLQIYSRDAGARSATVSFTNAADSIEIPFHTLPTAPVTLRILDENDQPTTAGLLIRDRSGRVYPSMGKRLAPDFFFHPQVYRASGEAIRLPAGEYTVEYSRGPEYLTGSRAVVLDGQPQTVAVKLERWVDPSLLGWWSGDHHIHAAGCAHYAQPSVGVNPADMIRHCMGEDLKVGAVLTWGPGFDHQKQFFSGAVDAVSRFPYLLRYDVEVSGFGSDRSGHLCLLRLKEQVYPGGDSYKHWPTLGLNTLKWAKRQGAICGPAHSGWGLEVRSAELPNYIVPLFNGIGANEYIVDVTHQVPGPEGQPVPAVDFMSTVDTPYVWELNMWYHTLNCGFRTRISGETDFPCIYGERVGLGRSYVKLDGALDYDQWCEGIRNGRNYVGDGRSHLMEFRVGDVAVGERGSELRLAEPGTVRVTAKVAALLNEQPNTAIQKRRYSETPYWHIERARIGETREVPVELVVNGYSVQRLQLPADGKTRDVAFEVPIARSSWVALRILPSSHTNPVFVLVGDRPIRASRRSADWCLKGVEQCWKQKKNFYKAAEQEAALQVYAHAREVYQKILDESEVE
jgi:hypothetical protein